MRCTLIFKDPSKMEQHADTKRKKKKRKKNP